MTPINEALHNLVQNKPTENAEMENNYYHQIIDFYENGADLDEVNESGKTPLANAIYYENDVAVKALLRAGANPNANNNQAFINAKDIKISKLLLSYGANINGTDERGETALHHSVTDINIDKMRFLLKNKANVNKADKLRVSL